MVTLAMQQQHEEQPEAPRPRRRMLAKEDPMSHRIIEKRRRDRMNNCLADLSRLIPADYLKKGRGRIEKTEIIEMAIKHIKYLQAQACRRTESPAAPEHYRAGYQDCLAEALHFMVEVEGYFAGDPVCVQLVNHLQKHCDKILNGEQVSSPRTAAGESSSSSGSSYAPRQGPAGSGSSGFGSGSSPCSGSGSGSDVGGGGKEAQPQQPPGAEDDEEAEVAAPGGYPLPPDAALPHHSAAPSLYKFKNNIKQRFSAERHTAAAPPPCGGAKRARYEAEDRPSPPPSPPHAPRAPGVPIFALHSEGSFYVPLTLDPELLAPHLPPEAGGGPVLHPVTISVSFQRTVPLDPPPWKTEPPFLPKWSLCAQDRP